MRLVPRARTKLGTTLSSRRLTLESLRRKLLQNPANLLRLPHGPGSIHEAISAYYSSKIPGLTGGLTVREWLSKKSFKEQFEFGISVIKKFGGARYLPPYLR